MCDAGAGDWKGHHNFGHFEFAKRKKERKKEILSLSRFKYFALDFFRCTNPDLCIIQFTSSMDKDSECADPGLALFECRALFRDVLEAG